MSTIQDVVKKTKSKKAEDAKRTLITFVDLINPKLVRYFDNEISRIFGVSSKQKAHSKHILEHIKEHNLRPCKRLRGSFVYYSYKLLGGKDSKEILKTSMCAEIVHTALLIHDDFMDRDAIRRGKPTTHKYYKGVHKEKYANGDPSHYGYSLAIMAGDFALMLGFEILSRSDFSPDLKIEALSNYLEGIGRTALGQAHDITLEAQGSSNEKDVIDLHHAKTAIYTYVNPIQTGAILAGAKDNDLELLNKYAVPGGIAFQLQDDVLGMFGNTKKTGKSAYADLKEGKVTLLTVYVLNNGSKEQVKRYKEIWGNKNIGKREANEARKIVVDTGSLQHSRKVSIKWAQKAQGAIPEMRKRKWNKEAIDYLDGIAQYMIERDL